MTLFFFVAGASHSKLREQLVVVSDEHLDRQIPGVNFINTLHAHFLYESKLSSFYLVTFGFVIFGT
jgi:hypothetical protein